MGCLNKRDCRIYLYSRHAAEYCLRSVRLEEVLNFSFNTCVIYQEKKKEKKSPVHFNQKLIPEKKHLFD